MKIIKLDDAVKKIKEGSLITYSGMQLSRPPLAIIREIIRQDIKNLSIVSIPNPLCTDMLIGAGLVRSAMLGFNGFIYDDGFVISPNYRRYVEEKKLELYETDIFEILQGLKAGSEGLEYIEVLGIKGTDYVKVNKNKITDKGIITKAIMPDFALIHAQCADKEGNVYIKDPLIEDVLVKASKNVIVTVEEVKEKIEDITVSKEKIASVSLEPNGSYPAACFPYYDYDKEELKRYVESCKKEKFKDYINEIKDG